VAGHHRSTGRPASGLDQVPQNDRALVALPPDPEALEAVWHVRRAIDLIPADEATIVRLQHLEGMTQSAIAQELGVPLGTVKTRSRRAYGRLAVLLEHLRTAPAH
jgi:RNA polymerase sigma factor (sigma-70 family)